jgi:hypothetical protein
MFRIPGLTQSQFNDSLSLKNCFISLAEYEKMRKLTQTLRQMVSEAEKSKEEEAKEKNCNNKRSV